MTKLLVRLQLCYLVLLLGSACGGGAADSGTESAPPSAGETVGGGGSGSSGGSGGDGTSDGGGGTDVVTPAPILLNIVTEEERILYLGSFLSDFAMVRDTAILGGLTPFDPAPPAGAVSYDGYMQLLIGNAAVSANVIGDATLLVDLSGGPVTGSATGFLGMTLDSAMMNQVVSYEGVVAITGGGVTEGGTGGSAISFGIDGALDNGQNTFGINGTLSGYLFGAEGSGLRATGSQGGISDDIDATIDGSGPVPVGIATVWALKE